MQIIDNIEPNMTFFDLKQRISETIKRSQEMDRVCHLTISGTGKFRIDGNFIILITEDGIYHRISKQKLDQDVARLLN